MSTSDAPRRPLTPRTLYKQCINFLARTPSLCAPHTQKQGGLRPKRGSRGSQSPKMWDSRIVFHGFWWAKTENNKISKMIELFFASIITNFTLNYQKTTQSNPPSSVNLQKSVAWSNNSDFSFIHLTSQHPGCRPLSGHWYGVTPCDWEKHPNRNCFPQGNLKFSSIFVLLPVSLYISYSPRKTRHSRLHTE